MVSQPSRLPSLLSGHRFPLAKLQININAQTNSYTHQTSIVPTDTRASKFSTSSFNQEQHSHFAAECSTPIITPINSILIANRGEIALRVARTAEKLGVRTAVVYTDADAAALHVRQSSHAISLGADTAGYLDARRIVEVAKVGGWKAIHPGYGFLSENSAFAKLCVTEGLIFIGPGWEAMEAMGNKSRSKEIMTAAGVPCIPGYHGPNQDPDFLLAEAEKIEFPVLIKAVKGGGGKGMRIAMTPDVFLDQLASAKSEARSSFGDDVMLVEKYIKTPRHIEVQVFADKHGGCVALGERDCSIQRRHQKVLEESPAPNLDDSVRRDLWGKARAAALAVKYEGAGTVEFIFDNDSGQFFFMEMNTRLQVEHPVTEMVTGEDLVHWQVLVAEGHPLPLSQADIEAQISQRGHAIEARIYAENPDMNFIPDSGQLSYIHVPSLSADVRVDAGFAVDDEVSAFYDPMIAKLIVRGSTREIAIRKLHAALEEYHIAGVVTNIEFIKRVCMTDDFQQGNVETGFIPKHHDELFSPRPPTDAVFIQAALGIAAGGGQAGQTVAHQPGFGKEALRHYRTLTFTTSQANGTPDLRPEALVKIELAAVPLQKDRAGYSVRIIRHGGESTMTEYPSLSCTVTPSAPSSSGEQASSTFKGVAQTITTKFPQTRTSTTLICCSPPTSPTTELTLFHLGTKHIIHLLPSACIPRALSGGKLGEAATATGITAPMPCRILRVTVRAGERVERDQPLLVIESMKMETTIRSPCAGTVVRVLLAAGNICRAGAQLIEFERENDE